MKHKLVQFHKQLNIHKLRKINLSQGLRIHATIQLQMANNGWPL